MKLQTASRKQAKIKLGLQGPSGSGKTMSALLVSWGICNDWSKIALVDTENHSADLYAHLGHYKTCQLEPPHSPEKFIEAIELCENDGAEVIILDSITHEWEYLIDYHSTLQGNSFTNWSKVTPRHNDFVKKILQSSCHVICTIRTKQDYVLSEKNGKMVPEKVGLKSVQKENIDYELTVVFDLNIKNHATASKDRTGLFFGKPEEKLSIATGELIRNWCNSGEPINIDDVSKRIGEMKTIQQLLNLYQEYPQFRDVLKPEFEQQKRRILVNNEVKTQLTHPLNFSTNGVH